MIPSSQDLQFLVKLGGIYPIVLPEIGDLKIVADRVFWGNGIGGRVFCCVGEKILTF